MEWTIHEKSHQKQDGIEINGSINGKQYTMGPFNFCMSHE